MIDKTEALIRDLAEKLGTTGEHLCGVLVRQAPTTGAIDLLVMAAALENIAIQIHTGELGEMQVSGGYGSGWSVEYRHTEGPTHEEYVKALTEYLGRSS